MEQRQLLSAEVQDFIRQHEHEDERALVLRQKEYFGIPSASIAAQISARRKAKEKLPSFYRNTIVYPPSLNLEQSSSEQTALFKASIIESIVKRPSKGADLTGGFGVDTFFMSQRVDQMVYVEPNENLLAIAKQTHQTLGAHNIAYMTLTAEAFAEKNDTAFDFIYLDPSRRSDSKKVFLLNECTPNILTLQGDLFHFTNKIFLKAAPMLDIKSGIKDLGTVSKVWIISVQNDCKELLFLLEKNFTGEPVIDATNISSKSTETFSFLFSEEAKTVIEFSDPLQYLYEPNASLLKAGAFKTVAHRWNLKKIEVNTHLYTSNDFIQDFPGRVFLINRFIKAERASKNLFPDGKANVITRNYPLSPDALKKKTGLTDGGDDYVIAFSGRQKKFVVHAKRER